MSMMFSLDYEHINEALKSRWSGFCQLRSEINSFSPRPLSDFEEAKKKRFKITQSSNPSVSEEQILAWVNKDLEFLASPHWQFQEMFRSRLMIEYITVSMLSHALCEALVNTMLTMGLLDRGSLENFKSFERHELKRKWKSDLKSFAPQYGLPEDSDLFKTLVFLCGQRNSLAHYKTQIHRDGKALTKDPGLSRGNSKDTLDWVLKFFSLPYDLSAFSQVVPGIPFLPIDRGGIEQAHDWSWGQV